MTVNRERKSSKISIFKVCIKVYNIEHDAKDLESD